MLEHCVLGVKPGNDWLQRHRGQVGHDRHQFLRHASRGGQVGDDRARQVCQGRKGFGNVTIARPREIEQHRHKSRSAQFIANGIQDWPAFFIESAQDQYRFLPNCLDYVAQRAVVEQ